MLGRMPQWPHAGLFKRQFHAIEMESARTRVTPYGRVSWRSTFIGGVLVRCRGAVIATAIPAYASVECSNQVALLRCGLSW